MHAASQPASPPQSPTREPCQHISQPNRNREHPKRTPFHVAIIHEFGIHSAMKWSVPEKQDMRVHHLPSAKQWKYVALCCWCVLCGRIDIGHTIYLCLSCKKHPSLRSEMLMEIESKAIPFSCSNRWLWHRFNGIANINFTKSSLPCDVSFCTRRAHVSYITETIWIEVITQLAANGAMDWPVQRVCVRCANITVRHRR